MLGCTGALLANRNMTVLCVGAIVGVNRETSIGLIQFAEMLASSTIICWYFIVTEWCKTQGKPGAVNNEVAGNRLHSAHGQT